MAGSERRPLSRERVVAAGMALADGQGLGAVTMRSVADALGVKPMSLYRHVGGKEDLLDGMVDAVFAEVALPDTEGYWRGELRARAVSVREVLSRHRWALGLMESRTSPGTATLRHHDAVVGVLLNGGFTPAATARAFTVLDAYVYGFALQEASLPLDERGEDMGRALTEGPGAEAFPYLASFALEHLLRPGYDFGAEFGPGLDLVLDAIGPR